jgi:hypothetical protein
MRRLTTFTLAILAALTFASGALAQDSYGAIQRLLDGETASANITAVSTHTPLVCKWVGPASTGGTITVAAGGDITFSTGPAGGSAVDTTLECPIVGALGGIFDVSNAACDTLGEVVNLVNRSPNWRCVLRDGMAADSADNTLITLAETAATAANGLALLADTAVTFDVAAELTPERSIQRSLDGPYQTITPNSSPGSRVALFEATTLSTYGAGTSAFEVFSCRTTYPSQWGPWVAATPALGYVALTDMTENCVQLENRPNGATTVSSTFNYPYAMEGRKGDRLIVRVNNSAAMTVPQLTAYGRVALLK